MCKYNFDWVRRYPDSKELGSIILRSSRGISRSNIFILIHKGHDEMNNIFQDLFVNIFRELAAWQDKIVIGLVAIAAFFILIWLFDLEKA